MQSIFYVYLLFVTPYFALASNFQGKIQKLWKAGSLPLSQLIFYNKTLPLDHRWHVLGLGHDFSRGRDELESASVIHYSGKLKPWLEISIPKYRDYWNRYLNYDNPHLQQCNIHG